MLTYLEVHTHSHATPATTEAKQHPVRWQKRYGSSPCAHHKGVQGEQKYSSTYT